MIYLSTKVFGTQTPAEDQRGKPSTDLEPPDKRKHTSGGGEDDVKVGLLDGGQMSVDGVVEGSRMEMKEINPQWLLMWTWMGRLPVWPFAYFHFWSTLLRVLAWLLQNTGWILHCSLPPTFLAHFGCFFFFFFYLLVFRPVFLFKLR